MGDLQQDLCQAHRTAQDKYVYFLLAAAGAGIGFAVNQTQGAKIALSQIPIALSVICWGMSFYFGCRQQYNILSCLRMNITLIQAQLGQEPTVGSNPQTITAATQALEKVIKEISDRANSCIHWQFRMLIIGAIFFLA